MKNSIFRKKEKTKEVTSNLAMKSHKKKFKKIKGKDYFRFFEHPIFFICNCFVGIVVLSIFFFVLYLFIESSIGEKAQFMWLLLFILSIISLCVHFYIFWRLNSFLVTKEALYIFRFKTIFSIETEMIPLEKISTFDMEKSGLWATMFGYGNIILASLITDSSVGTATIFLKNISRPQQTLEKIKNITQIHSDRLLKIIKNDAINTG